jgi:hypothetical protein
MGGHLFISEDNRLRNIIGIDAGECRGQFHDLLNAICFFSPFAARWHCRPFDESLRP